MKLKVLKPVRRCDECGRRKTDVTKVADPIAAEVNNETWARWLCGGCHRARLEDS